MKVRSISQPKIQLGHEIEKLLNSKDRISSVVFVSAFVSLKTILRLREKILTVRDNGGSVRLVFGIDLGGTSKEVLEEVLKWECECLLFHNPIPRSTFHPKLYIFEFENHSHIFVGSNNLTDGGLYTNYEAAVHFRFKLPDDKIRYAEIRSDYAVFVDPKGGSVLSLTKELLSLLVERGDVPSEAEVRRRRAAQRGSNKNSKGENPFKASPVPLPPILGVELREKDAGGGAIGDGIKHAEQAHLPSPVAAKPIEYGILVWQKTLSASDGLQVKRGSNPVGGVRLTQAKFEGPDGERINQTTYFRRLFSDYEWEAEGARANQEHTFVPIRLIIGNDDFGVVNFEIGHKPSGEAGQGNYTTILRWGRALSPVIKAISLKDCVFSLYENGDDEADFLIKITRP